MANRIRESFSNYEGVETTIFCGTHEQVVIHFKTPNKSDIFLRHFGNHEEEFKFMTHMFHIQIEGEQADTELKLDVQVS
ncbi:MAG: hypothetical protein HRU19_24545 [Pseudobacteriovorax sp.]|nr:hypothetical protein [Pseudobacteriovorax sp.]